MSYYDFMDKADQWAENDGLIYSIYKLLKSFWLNYTILTIIIISLIILIVILVIKFQKLETEIKQAEKEMNE